MSVAICKDGYICLYIKVFFQMSRNSSLSHSANLWVIWIWFEFNSQHLKLMELRRWEISPTRVCRGRACSRDWIRLGHWDGAPGLVSGGFIGGERHGGAGRQACMLLPRMCYGSGACVGTAAVLFQLRASRAVSQGIPLLIRLPALVSLLELSEADGWPWEEMG